MNSRCPLMVSAFLLLFTCAVSANVAAKRHREHRHLRHQLVSRVVRHRDNPLKEIATNTDSAAEDTQATLGLNSAPEVTSNTDEAADESEDGGGVPDSGGGPLADIAANTDSAAEGIENAVQGQQPPAGVVIGQDDPKPCRHGGRTVESGWKGPGLGGNSCTCNDGMLICTEAVGAAPAAAPAGAVAASPASAPFLKQASAEDDGGDDDGDDDDSGEDTAADEEEARLQLAVTNATKALAENLRKQEQLRKKKALLEDVDKSDEEIDLHVRLVTNETESAAMAGMLGSMWKDIRMLEAPEYIKFLEEEIEKLKKAEPMLKQKLASAQAALARKQAESDEGVHASAAIKEVPASMKELSMPINATLSATEDPSQWKPWWMEKKYRTESISGGLVYFAFGLIFAVLYYQARKRQSVLHSEVDYRPGTWSIPLFGCFTNKWICFVGCCCPFARWADTVDRAKVGFTYGPAVVLMLFLMVLDPYTYGVTGLMAVALGVKCRQSLRKKYGLKFGRGTYAEDCLTWCFCSPCAIIQEAHEEVANRDRPERSAL